MVFVGDVVKGFITDLQHYVINVRRRYKMSRSTEGRLDEQGYYIDELFARLGVPTDMITPEGEAITERPADIDTSKLAKVMVPHRMMERLLGLPADVKITSMHTTRGEEETGVYVICDRLNQVLPGAVAPEITIEDINSIGLWDHESNQ